MNLKFYSHKFAEQILNHNDFIETFNEICWVCKNTPIPVFKNKSKMQKRLDVVQQIMDSYLTLQFKTLGWNVNKPISSDGDSIKFDYLKEIHKSEHTYRLQIEVEFGNVASTYRNYFKLQMSNLNQLCDIGIIITPTETLSRRIDSGVASFEKTIKEIQSGKLLFNFPILVIGLDDQHSDEWDVKAVEPDLKVLQNKNKTSIKHELLVLDYINSLKRL
ncbi:BglII/BstYI family type II restriction endonuclease [Priestia abyssalis]|uniref:BglII/BstYI family type II restriction endonuclease n=1 Tax=Priestia abyssalis TaxID=1221450 RepID=UPI000994AB2E|nr:BglII/BstYI family type II restriction endonuclease [Priestia abyssalis]